MNPYQQRSTPLTRSLRFILFLLLLAVTSPVAYPAAPATRPTSLPGVKNFAQVSPILYRGAQPTAEGFAEMKRQGIRTIVNLRSSSSSDRRLLQGLGLRYVHIPAYADKIGQRQLIQFLKILEDPTNHPVFVHCHRGADRTGYAVAAYRIVEQGWSTDDALAEMHRFRFNKKYQNIPRNLRSLDADAIERDLVRAKAPKPRIVP